MAKPFSLADLRARAVLSALRPTDGLAAVLGRVGFVQADPIRAPARAQDLILRQRVAGYRAGQLEATYPTLGLEEDYLYAYGFLTRAAWRLLHPRRVGRLNGFSARVLELVRASGPTHPRHLEDDFGGGRVVNAWGGTSKQTTQVLERLHHVGLLRVARRERGLRVYEAAPAFEEALTPGERLRGLCELVAGILAPVPEKTMHTLIAGLLRRLPGARDHRGAIAALLREGRLERQVVDGVAYVWPVAATDDSEVPRQVRFLAPFDPVVWDRRRFEHLWGWAYRFEAYTPVAKRVRGYYALPVLWGERVIGWANANVSEGELDVQLGYVAGRPRGKDFTREVDAEVERLRAFL
jgi:uncharacterized protein